VTQLDPLKFIKGMNQKPDPELGEWQDITNLDISQVGIAKATKVNSVVRTCAATVNSFVVGSTSTAEEVLDGVGNNLYTGSTLLKAFTANPFSGVSQSGRIYSTNTTDGVWGHGSHPTYVSPTMYRAGAPIPTVGAFAAALGAAGSFTGAYTIVCTFVNANGYEGNPSAEITVPALTADAINLSDIPVNTDADYNISSRKIYITGGTTPSYSEYVLLDTISDNTTTSLTGLDTTDVDVLTVLEYDNDIPEDARTLVSHYDTFFGIGYVGDENSLMYSKAGRGEQWPIEQKIKISRPGDYPRGIVVWDSVLWVGTPSRIYQIIGSPGSGALSSNFYIKETRTKKGMITPNGNIATPFGLYYMAEDGIFKFDGSASDHVSHTCQDILNRVNLTTAAIDKVCGVYYDNKLFFSIPLDSSTTPDITIIYDFETDQWFTHDHGYTAFYADYINNDLYVANGVNVEKYQGGSTYTNWSIKTKDLSMGAGQYTSWNEYEFDFDGTCTANIYMDGVLAVTESIVTSGREVVTRTFPNQMARRVAIELVGAAKATQDKIYSIRVSAETIGEKGEP
jgi:hypothetical protein